MNKTFDIASLKALYLNSAVLRMEFFFGQQFWEEAIGNPISNVFNFKELGKEVIVAKFATVEKVK